MVLVDLYKYESLLNLINSKHSEWKKLSIRGLMKESGYKQDTCRKALKILKEADPQTPQPINKKSKKKPSIHSTEGASSPPSQQFSEMTDYELMRHTARQVILTSNDAKTKLDAVSKLMSLKDKIGELSIIKNKNESDSVSRFTSLPISKLARLAAGKLTPTELLPNSEGKESS